MWIIDFYETANGNKPVQDFLDGLDTKMRTKALKEIGLLKEFGTVLREPYSKPIQDGIFELRIQFASDISRIFYFFYIKNRIILTNGYIKKTQKTPKNEIALAIKFKNDFIERKKKNV